MQAFVKLSCGRCTHDATDSPRGQIPLYMDDTLQRTVYGCQHSLGGRFLARS